MSEQTITCVCGHPHGWHGEPDHEVFPPVQGICLDDECTCVEHRPRTALTMPAIADTLTQIRDRLARDLEQSAADFERAHTADEGIMRSHRTRGHGLRLAGESIATLLTHVEESEPAEPPARPLEADPVELEGEADEQRYAVEEPEDPLEDCIVRDRATGNVVSRHFSRRGADAEVARLNAEASEESGQ